jgi:hypothetical protein
MAAGVKAQPELNAYARESERGPRSGVGPASCLGSLGVAEEKLEGELAEAS